MKILLVSPHFYPENFKCNDMAFELRKRGHDVTVMTAIPDYPLGKFYDGYGIFKKRREIINGIKVHRSFLIPRGNGSSLRLMLNYLSYTFFATLKSIWFGLCKRFDVIIVHETSPIMVGIPAVIIKKLQKIPMYFWVLDLWPESLSAAGGIKNKRILSVFESLTKWIYANSTSILIGSRGYHKAICQKGDFDKKIHYFPNWVDEIKSEAKIQLPELPNGFNIVFTGNIGESQDFEHIIDCAKLLNYNKEINFIIIGDGRKKEWVQTQIIKHNLTQVKCLGRFSAKDMQHFYQQASILFLALKDQPIFALTAPAKLQGYMSSGKPIVAMINGEGADLIREADCGWSVPAEDSEALANLILTLSKEEKAILQQKGENGRRFSQEHFDFKKCIDNLENLINSSIYTKDKVKPYH